jgi:hypothetical protein
MNAGDVDEHTARRRALVLEVLEGRITPENDAVFLFEEDTFFFTLLAMMHGDREWLEARLSDETYPLAARELVRRLLPRSISGS